MTNHVTTQIDRMAYEDQEERLFGRGSRSRKTVDYSETLTERQWIRAIEDGNLEEEEEKKKEKKEKKQKRKLEKDDELFTAKVRLSTSVWSLGLLGPTEEFNGIVGAEPTCPP